MIYENILGLDAYYEEGKCVHLIKYDSAGIPHDIPTKYVLPQMALVIDNDENELFIKATLKELPKPNIYSSCEELPGNYSDLSRAITHTDNQELTYEEDELLRAKYDTTASKKTQRISNPYRYVAGIIPIK
jgi:hypothetical protein